MALQVAEQISGKQATDLAVRLEKEIYAKVSGLEIFAERVGLSIDRLLAFSTALEFNFVQLYQRDLDTLSGEEMELAKLACSEMEYLWKNLASHSVFTVAG